MLFIFGIAICINLILSLPSAIVYFEILLVGFVSLGLLCLCIFRIILDVCLFWDSSIVFDLFEKMEFDTCFAFWIVVSAFFFLYFAMMVVIVYCNAIRI